MNIELKNYFEIIFKVKVYNYVLYSKMHLQKLEIKF